MKDQLFKHKLSPIPKFQFDEKVALVFDDMVTRSVPKYLEFQALLVELTNAFTQEGDTVCDLGCSTGTTLKLIAQKLAKKKLHLLGLDNSPEMLNKAKIKLKKHSKNCSLNVGDLNKKLTLKRNPKVIILALTLQFVKPENRAPLIQSLYKKLVTGGALFIIEKIKPQKHFDNLIQNLYYDFKAENKYSKLEITQKREALENILTPWTEAQTLKLLENTGFKADTFFKWLNFCGFIATKEIQ